MRANMRLFEIRELVHQFEQNKSANEEINEINSFLESLRDMPDDYLLTAENQIALLKIITRTPEPPSGFFLILRNQFDKNHFLNIYYSVPELMDKNRFDTIFNFSYEQSYFLNRILDEIQ